jgi:drug/metabolite transporter (DMT)-like permease
MSKERFPFATQLTSLHMMTSFVCGLLVYLIRPSLYPTMQKAWGDKTRVLKYFLPISVLFCASVVLSNIAYIYCDVAFLQFMKQANIAGVFYLSCLAGSQICDRMKVFTLTTITIGCCIAVHGELHFVLIGFLIQATSQVNEVAKIVLQEWILSGSELKLDPLTFLIFMSPCCMFFLGFANILSWNDRIAPQFMVWWPYLLANACTAFILNLLGATLIKHLSALAFNLTGVIKDIFIILLSCYVFHTKVEPQQVVGFSLATSGIFFWAFMKNKPSHSAVVGMASLLGMPRDKNEKTPLLVPLARREWLDESDEKTPLLVSRDESGLPRAHGRESEKAY